MRADDVWLRGWWEHRAHLTRYSGGGRESLPQ